MRYKMIAAVSVLGALMAALVVAIPASAAGNAGTTTVERIDPTGAVFTCPDATYTVTGGTLLTIYHESVSPNGGDHVTGTNNPIGVTLTDGVTDTVYHLSGASWFGGMFNENTDFGVFTDTEFFNILGPTGGVVARVAAVEHMGPNGSFSFNFGQCEPPED